MAQIINVAAMNYEDYRQKFAVERETISKEIQEYIRRMADIKEFVNCELYFNSKIQYVIESVGKYLDIMIMLQNSLDVSRSNVLNGIVNEANSNFSFKSSQEKMIMIDGNQTVALTKQFIELFNNQVLFMNDTKKNLDSIVFNMKYRFEAQKMLS